MTGCRPAARPQPGEPVHRIYNPRVRVVQRYPQAPDTRFGHLLQPAWTAGGCSFPRPLNGVGFGINDIETSSSATTPFVVNTSNAKVYMKEI